MSLYQPSLADTPAASSLAAASPILAGPDQRGLYQALGIQEARQLLDQFGYCFLTLEAGDRDGRQMLDIVSALGQARMHDEFGRIVWDVKFHPGLQEESCARSMSMRSFPFHTDASFEDPTPRYVALYVVQADMLGGGRSQLISTKSVLKAMSPETRRVLSETDFSFWVPDEFLIDVPVRRQPILFGFDLIRYRREIIDHDSLTPAQLAALDELDRLVTEAPCLEFSLNNGELLIFDNGRFLHGRTKILDPDRHLLRMRFSRADLGQETDQRNN